MPGFGCFGNLACAGSNPATPNSSHALEWRVNVVLFSIAHKFIVLVGFFVKTEFEVKILDIDVADVKKRLQNVGAVKVAERSMRRFVYDLERIGDSCKSWIRLRDNGENTTLTYKQIDSFTVDGTKEIEFVVGSFEQTDCFLRKLGFAPTAYQENKRVEFVLNGVEVDIDYWPKIQPYLEIEADSTERVEEIVKLLGFAMSDAVSIDVMGVFKKYGFNIHDFKELKF